MLCFSKNCAFQIFDRSNLFLNWSKIRLKFWFESIRFNRCLIASGSIESNFRSIENRMESFFKTFSFSRVQTLFQTFKALSLSTRSIYDSKLNFCHFPLIFLRGFCLLRPVRPLYPSFFIYFHVFTHYWHAFWEISNLWKFRDFVDLSLFFGNWSMGFCCGIKLIFLN